MNKGKGIYMILTTAATTKIDLSERSLELLHRRNLTQTEVDNFSTLLFSAQQQMQQSGITAKKILQNMSPADLALIQKANSLADKIIPSTLSTEGAANLLAQVDFSNRVDLNNDGIVEVGIARSIIFPPVNAPDFVKKAFNEATKGMSDMDKSLIMMHMHIAMYGIETEGNNLRKAQGAIEKNNSNQEWLDKNITRLFSSIREGLAFNVALEGWTKTNMMMNDFYNNFESALAKNISSFSSFKHSLPTTHSLPTAQASASSADASTNTSTNANQINNNYSEKMKELFTLVLDARIGVDRAKLQEIEEKIEAIENDKNLSAEDKQKLLQQLEQEKAKYLEQVQQRFMENEKRKAVEHSNTQLKNTLMPMS